MGIFGKIKQAFGFGSAEYEYEDDTFGIDATVKPLNRPEQSSTDTDPGESPAQEYGQPDTQSEPVPLDSIFNSVVNMFNEALPSFLGDAANADVQRRKLYDALDNDVKAFIENVQKRAADDCDRRWQRERSSLDREVSSLKEQLHNMEENGSEKGKQLLSAERQKRAMNERLHDLENQITRLEAEKEQYELENRSLVNKLRISNMVNDGMEVPDVTTYEQRISDLQASCDEAKATLATMQSEKEALEARNKTLNEQLEALKVKTDMTDVMLNDLNNRAATSLQEISQRDAEIASLNEQLSEKTQQCRNLADELSEARTNLEIAAHIQEEIEQVQELMTRKNNQITELNNEIRRRDERINALEAEEASLRKTIEANLMSQAASEKSLREDIERLEQQVSQTTIKEKSRSRRKTTPKISAIDEDLDNTDWLVATPPEGTSAKTSGVSDSEFGYQEPQRKTPPENSAQMSLW